MHNRSRTLLVGFLLILVMLASMAFTISGSVNAGSGPSPSQTGDDGDDEEDDGDTDSDGGRADSPLCTGDTVHPVGTSIADTYEVEYSQVMDWFCDGFGFGEIMLALETGKALDEDAGDLLDAKGQGNGWGKIWKEKGLIGNAEDAGPPPHARANRQDKADKAKENGNNGKGNGNGNAGDTDDDEDTGSGKGNSDNSNGKGNQSPGSGDDTGDDTSADDSGG